MSGKEGEGLKPLIRYGLKSQRYGFFLGGFWFSGSLIGQSTFDIIYSSTKITQTLDLWIGRFLGRMIIVNFSQ